MKDFFLKAKDFFVDLYDKFIHLSWVEWTIDYCKTNPLMAGIIGGLIVFIILLLIIIRIARRKARKAKKAAKRAAKQAKKEAKKAKKQPAVATVEAEAPKAPTETPAPAPVEEVANVAPVEEVANVAPVEEKAEATTAPVEEIVETPAEEPAPVEEPAPMEEKPASDIAETLTMLENVDESLPEAIRDHYEEGETDKMARYAGKWTICRVLTDAEDSEETYFFELHASNGEKLLSSEEYTTYQGALRGIQTHKTNILNGNLKITVSKKGDYIFKVLSGKNSLLCLGENYPTRARCESAIESTVRFAETAVLDENVQDVVIKVPQEDDSPVEAPVDGCIGKWIILCNKDENDQNVYSFELFANNGERLLASEDYTTYIGAINGIQTYKNNIKKDNFRISLTKRGDYIYKLLNGNGQLLCLGEHYKTKRLCQNAVESVKRFALSSPVLTEEKL